MSAPYHSIERKTEDAVKALLDTLNLDGVPIYVGQDNADETEEGEPGLRVPYIICIADSAEQYMEGESTGIYSISVRVEVWSHKHDEPGAAHAERLAKVRDKLITDTLAADLSTAVADFHCLHVMSSGMISQSEGNHYMGGTDLTLIVSPSDL